MKPRFIAIVVLGLALLAAAGCGKTGAWNYVSAISQPLSGTSSAKPITIGSLDREKVSIAVPGGTFDKPTKVTVSSPDSAPAMPDKKMPPAICAPGRYGGPIPTARAGNRSSPNRSMPGGGRSHFTHTT